MKQKLSHRRAELVSVQVDRLLCKVAQRPQCPTCIGGVAVPDKVAKSFDVDPDVVEAGLVLRPQGIDAGQRLLDVTHTHRDVPPVEDVAHLPSRRSAHEVGQCRLAVADGSDRATRLPAPSEQRSSDGLRRLCSAQRRQCKALRRPPRGLDLANRHVEVTTVVTRCRCAPVRCSSHVP